MMDLEILERAPVSSWREREPASAAFSEDRLICPEGVKYLQELLAQKDYAAFEVAPHEEAHINPNTGEKIEVKIGLPRVITLERDPKTWQIKITETARTGDINEAKPLTEWSNTYILNFHRETYHVNCGTYSRKLNNSDTYRRGLEACELSGKKIESVLYACPNQIAASSHLRP